jgi:hypothetical protein
MKARRSTYITAMTLLTSLLIPVRLVAQDNHNSEEGTLITFDAPGAGTGAGQGTEGQAISPSGAVAGVDADASSVLHGFLRTAEGTITTFDAPGAGTAGNQ